MDKRDGIEAEQQFEEEFHRGVAKRLTSDSVIFGYHVNCSYPERGISNSYQAQHGWRDSNVKRRMRESFGETWRITRFKRHEKYCTALATAL